MEDSLFESILSLYQNTEQEIKKLKKDLSLLEERYNDILKKNDELWKKFEDLDNSMNKIKNTKSFGLRSLRFW